MTMIVNYDTVLYLAAGVATALWAGRSEDRIPGLGDIFRTLAGPPQGTLESCIMGTGSLSRGGGVNLPARGVEPPTSI